MFKLKNKYIQFIIYEIGKNEGILIVLLLHWNIMWSKATTPFMATTKISIITSRMVSVPNSFLHVSISSHIGIVLSMSKSLALRNLPGIRERQESMWAKTKKKTLDIYDIWVCPLNIKRKKDWETVLQGS